MKTIITIVSGILLILSLGLNVFFYQKISGDRIVDEVVDGDTFQLRSGKRVRLLGLDAPEYDRCAGPEAKARLTQLLLHKKVTLYEETPEAFGRYLALVYADGKWINTVMMEEGWGVPDYRKNSRRDEMTEAYHEAQRNKSGIFALCRDVKLSPDADCVIKGNIDSSTYEKFYHFPGCRYYDGTKIDTDRGEQYFCTEEEAQSAGFVKSANCP